MAKRNDLFILILRSYEGQKPISYRNLVVRTVCQFCKKMGSWPLYGPKMKMHRSFLLAMAGEINVPCGWDYTCWNVLELPRILQKNFLIFSESKINSINRLCLIQVTRIWDLNHPPHKVKKWAHIRRFDWLRQHRDHIVTRAIWSKWLFRDIFGIKLSLAPG